MPPVTPQAPQNPKAFKSQPWMLFDTIAAHSFLIGDPSQDAKAVGGDNPAISASGEIVFFQAGGRTRATMPWFTNLDVQGQLAYGLQVWQVALKLAFPAMQNAQNLDPNADDPVGVPTTVRLAEAILNYAVLQLNLGQEEQIEWPVTAFGAGGGLSIQGGGGEGGISGVNNSQPQSMNVMKLPEPIEMVRTQNLSAKIRLAPQVFEIIGTAAAVGVGAPLAPYTFQINNEEPPDTVSRRLPPYSIELRLIGRRVKATQYGQLVRDPNE
jgi:hypothetical protein